MCAALCCASLAAQADYTQLSPPQFPSPRAGGVGVTDGAVLYHFGGKPGPTGELNDMWVFDGANWADVTPTSGPLPPARDWYAATFDTARGVYVLFGGRSTALGTNLGDTWEFDGAAWTQRTPANAPPVRRWSQMAYDLTTGRCILFGGFDDGAYYDDTWAWNGTDWTQLQPTNRPSPRGRGRMSYDITRLELVYFGGLDAGGALADTWLWNGSDWSQIATPNAPSDGGGTGRYSFGMTYDLIRDRHVLFGGRRNGPPLADTWEFDGVDWTQVAASGPISRSGPTFAFVPGFGKSILFGGFTGPQQNDTWEYQTQALASSASYGSGCSGPGGPLGLTATSRPWVGDSWSATCGLLGASSLALEVWGLNTAQLPLTGALPNAGPGCDLLNSADLIAGPTLPSGGVATVQLPLPNNPALAGVALNLQVAELEFDTVGNWVGVYTSNGLTATLGVR